jgi:hypothetical protein
VQITDCFCWSLTRHQKWRSAIALDLRLGTTHDTRIVVTYQPLHKYGQPTATQTVGSNTRIDVLWNLLELTSLRTASERSTTSSRLLLGMTSAKCLLPYSFFKNALKTDEGFAGRRSFSRPSHPLSLEPRMAFLLFCFGQPHTLVWLHLSSNTHEGQPSSSSLRTVSNI